MSRLSFLALQDTRISRNGQREPLFKTPAGI